MDPNATICIADDGAGVPEDLLDRLFEPFARGPGSREAGEPGLGLAIASAIAEAMGGKLWHEPVVPHGARFLLQLRIDA
jgi:signal transduction histidine kinase